MDSVAITETRMKEISYISVISHSTASVMAGFSHTLPYCLSKLRSRVEAGKKQPRRSLEYSYSMEKVLLYPSFGAPLVFLGSPYGDSEWVRRRLEGYAEKYAVGGHMWIDLRSRLSRSVNQCSGSDDNRF